METWKKWDSRGKRRRGGKVRIEREVGEGEKEEYEVGKQ